MKNYKFWFSLLLIIILSILVWYWRGGFKPLLTYKNQPVSSGVICIDLNENTTLKSPLHLTGEARGYWFFEGSFPVTLLDQSSNILANGIAVTSVDWMTEELIPFVIDFKFEKPLGNTGLLILHRDNPSGLSENDDSLEIPVKF